MSVRVINEMQMSASLHAVLYAMFSSAQHCAQLRDEGTNGTVYMKVCLDCRPAAGVVRDMSCLSHRQQGLI
jgi:hypothetical protein